MRHATDLHVLPHNTQTNMRKQANKACGAEQAECVDAKVEGVDEGVWCRASRRRSWALQMVLMKGAPDGVEEG